MEQDEGIFCAMIMVDKLQVPKFFVSKAIELEIRKGLRVLGPKQIEKSKGEISAGEIAWIVDATGKFIAKGFANPKSHAMVQLISLHEKEIINESFFEKKIVEANEFRQKILGYKNTYRLFYGESDGIPGLLVDRFENICSLQISCMGVEKYKQQIAQILLGLDGISTIAERNDFRNRESLGLDPLKGVLLGKPKVQTVIEQGRVKFEVDVLRGHKTGFYLDQSENRAAIEKYCNNGTKMLDVFSYTGGFGLHAARAGANVTMIDLPEAILQAKRNAKLNGLEDKITFIEGKAFDETNKLMSRPERFDVISLDPPAFVQKPGNLRLGKKAYHQINYNCMKLLKSGGILVTSSCSAGLSYDEFISVIVDAANHASKRAEIIEMRFSAKDHLVPAYTKRFGSYLKCLFLRVHDK